MRRGLPENEDTLRWLSELNERRVGARVRRIHARRARERSSCARTPVTLIRYVTIASETA